MYLTVVKHEVQYMYPRPISIVAIDDCTGREFTSILFAFYGLSSFIGEPQFTAESNVQVSCCTDILYFRGANIGRIAQTKHFADFIFEDRGSDDQ